LGQIELRFRPFVEFIDSHQEGIEVALRTWLPISPLVGTERFNKAVDYAVFPGGKRLRAYLTFVASLLGGVTAEQALKLSCAVEFIHTSSIVLDDLPSMDDGDLRRSRPALHVAFGEADAILVALALLNQSYALFADSVPRTAPAETLQHLLKEVTERIGSFGMIAGQSAELLASSWHGDESISQSCALKTTGLMRLMMVAGGTVSGSSAADLEALATFGECLGKAYQIYDDLADANGDRQSTGKCVRQDFRHNRASVIRGLDLEDSRNLANGIMEAGTDALLRFGDRAETRLLKSAAAFIVDRLNKSSFSLSPAVQSTRAQGVSVESRNEFQRSALE
jgi:geranylgeranyl pyrophosphate synthase